MSIPLVAGLTTAWYYGTGAVSSWISASWNYIKNLFSLK
jgi:hypothetical protein